MNPDQPSRAEIEVKLTALLLGELPEEEARLLRWTVAQNPELQQLHDQLQQTIGIVREVVAKPEASGDAAPLKLSADRRQKLLAHFKTPRRHPLFWLKPLPMPSLISMLVVVAFVAILAAMLLPALSAAKSKHKYTKTTLLSAQRMPEPVAEASSVSQSAEVPAPIMPAEAKSEGDAVATVPVAAPPTVGGRGNWAVEAKLRGVYYDDQSTVSDRRDLHIKAEFKEVYDDDQSAKQPAGAAISSKPEVITVAPAPVLAPPPAPPVIAYGLEQNKNGLVAETTPPAAGSGFSGGSGGSGGGVYSQNVVGYVNQPLAGSTPAVQEPSPTLSVADSDSDGRATLNGEVNGVAKPELKPGTSAIMPESSSVKQFVVDTQISMADVEKRWNRKLDANATDTPAQPSAPVGGAMATRKPATQALTDSAGAVFSFDANTETISSTNSVVLDNGLATSEPVSGKLAFPNQPPSNLGADLALGDKVTPGTAFFRRQARGNSADSSHTLGAPLAAPSRDRQMQTSATETVPVINGLNRWQSTAPAASPVATAGLVSANQLAGDIPVTVPEDYAAAKAKLDQMKEIHSLVLSKIDQTKKDAEVPQSSLVTVVDPAEPGKSQGAWQHLTGQVKSKARIKIENEGSDISYSGPSSSGISYDPYFIQTTFEIIQSDAVLEPVVSKLKLDDALDKKEAIARLRKRLDLQPVKNTKLIEIGVVGDQPIESAKIANAVAEAYKDYRISTRKQLAAAGAVALQDEYAKEEKQIAQLQAQVDQLVQKAKGETKDEPVPTPHVSAPVPQPEVLTRENAFSTFSLNVSDVAFKLTAASLEKGQLPDVSTLRSEEFINAFDYHDPEAQAGQPMAFAAERARYPFAVNRDLLRFSVKTAAAGRPANQPLNLVLLLDNSGSMERADRVAIIQAALKVLATQLHPQDTLSVVAFARTAHLWADGVRGDQAGETLDKAGRLTPQGGTNLEEAMRLAYETALRHYQSGGLNRVVLFTDGAANLGNVDAAVLREKVETARSQGIALDCFGIGWEGYNDDLLEQLSSHGDGRYAFLNAPEEVAKEFAAKLAGGLQVAASDVKVQVEFNPERVISWRQFGYAKHQLTKEQFRDNTVDAAEIGAREAGNALYTVETKPDGTGPIATVRVRYKVPGTADYQERSWEVPYAGNALSLERSSAALRLAGMAGAFAEWLAQSPHAQQVSPAELLKIISGVPQIYSADERPKQLEWMIREAQRLADK